MCKLSLIIFCHWSVYNYGLILQTHSIDSIWKLCARHLCGDCCCWCDCWLWIGKNLKRENEKRLENIEEQVQSRKSARRFCSRVKMCEWFVVACCLIAWSIKAFTILNKNNLIARLAIMLAAEEKNEMERRRKKLCRWIQFYREFFDTDHKPTRILSNAKGLFLCISISCTVSPSTLERWNLTEPRAPIQREEERVQMKKSVANRDITERIERKIK